MRKVVLVLIILVTMQGIHSYSWPMKDSSGNFNEQLSVSGALGDLRGTTSLYRFHRGIDIAETGAVYPVFGGFVHHDGVEDEDDNPYVRIGNFWYIHLENRIEDGTYVTGIEDGDPGTIVPIGYTDGGNHLHFQIGSFDTDGPYYNPITYADSLDNYSDDNLPVFDSIIYYKAFTTINELEASIETTDVRVKPDSVLDIARVVPFVRFSKI